MATPPSSRKHRPTRRPVPRVVVKIAPEWMNVEEAAQYLRLPSKGALYALIYRGDGPDCYRVGKRALLFSKSDLDAYVRARKVPRKGEEQE